MPIEDIIRKAYAHYLSKEAPGIGGCLDEEALACYCQGRLSEGQRRRIETHLSLCSHCCQAAALYTKVEVSDEQSVPQYLIEKAKAMLPGVSKAPVFDVIVAVRAKALALLGTNAKNMRDRDMALLPVLRGGGITAFKEELILVKDLSGVKITLYMEKREKNKVRIKVILADRKNRKLLTHLRIALFKDDTELESYAVQSGMAVFEDISFGVYTLEILRKQSSIGRIRVEIK